jgi:protein-tyrosine-phosphatase
MAQGILGKMLEQQGVTNVEVASAGTHGLHFTPASVFATEAAGEKSVDISRHRSRRLTGEMIRQTDLILVLSQEHLEHIRRMHPAAADRVYLLKSFPLEEGASNGAGKPSVLSIKDPVGGDLEEYRIGFSEIEKEIKRILPELLRRAAEA